LADFGFISGISNPQPLIPNPFTRYEQVESALTAENTELGMIHARSAADERQGAAANWGRIAQFPRCPRWSRWLAWSCWPTCDRI